VWAATPGGLLRVDPDTGAASKWTTADGLADADLLAVEPFGDSLVLVGRRILATFDGSQTRPLPSVPNADPARPAIVAALGDRLFATTMGTLYVLEPQSKDWAAVSTPESPRFVAVSEARLRIAGEQQIWASADGLEWVASGTAPDEPVSGIQAYGRCTAVGTRSALHISDGPQHRVLPVTGLPGATHLAGITCSGKRLFAAVHGSGLWSIDLGLRGAKLTQVSGAGDGERVASQARSILVHRGEVWLGASDGLFRQAGEKWHAISVGSEPPGNVCVAVARHQGTLWVVTHDGGIARLVDGRWVAGGGPTRSHVLQLASEGTRLWARHPDGTLSYLEARQWRSFKPASTDRLKWTSTLVSSPEGVWAGSWAGATLRPGDAPNGGRKDWYDAVPLQREPVTAVTKRGGELWLGTARQGLATRMPDGSWRAWHEGNGPRDGWITALTSDGRHVWAGTFNGGLAMWDGARWSYPDPIPTPSGRKITSLALDRDGALWVGTRAGLARWFDGKWTALTQADGLCGDEIQCLLADGDTLWVGTRTGLTQLPLRAAHRLTQHRMRSIGSTSGPAQAGFAPLLGRLQPSPDNA